MSENNSQQPTSETKPQLTQVALFEASPTIGKLVDALSKAQAEMKPAKLDCVNPHYKSKYASLTSVKDAYQAPIAKQGLAVSHQVFSAKEFYYVRTMLVHSSGEFFANTLKLLVGKQDMQGLGSAITYAKRYSVSALLDIVDTDDDDGNASLPEKPNQNNKSQAQTPPAQKAGGNPQSKPPLQNHAPGALSQDQIKRLYAIGNSKGWSSGYLRLKVYVATKLTPSQLSLKQYDDLCAKFEAREFNAKDKAELDIARENMTPEIYERVVGKKPESNEPPPQEFPPDESYHEGEPQFENE